MPRQPHDLRRPALALAAALLVAGTAHGADIFGPIITDGPDTVIGGAGNETFEGREGADSIRGMEGDDLVYGNGGDDSVGGGPGDDQVRGGRGRDAVNGGQGDDTVSGDRDDDTLTGGLGADRFIFDNLSGNDTILDFNSVDGDRIELPTGMPLTVADTPDGFTIQLGAGGGRLLVAGVKFSAMGTWQAAPLNAAGPPPQLATVADPPAPPRKLLLAAIVALSIAFVGLLGVGLVQLVRSGRDRRL
jgi:Ca2+-binding RTX toxin-like protein